MLPISGPGAAPETPVGPTAPGTVTVAVSDADMFDSTDGSGITREMSSSALDHET
jgi:hypothetical protein